MIGLTEADSKVGCKQSPSQGSFFVDRTSVYLEICELCGCVPGPHVLTVLNQYVKHDNVTGFTHVRYPLF